MKIKLVTIALCIVTLFSCNTSNKYKYSVGLSDDYPPCNDVHLIKGDTIIWTPTSPCSREVLGKFFHYHDGDSVRTELLWNTNEWYAPIIEGHIVDYAKNDCYLLADQKPLDSILGGYVHDGNGRYHGLREYDTTMNYNQLKKQLEDTPTTHQYWIMVVKTADVYGPFSYEDYIDMKNKLGVPPTLKLKREKKENSNK